MSSERPPKVLTRKLVKNCELANSFVNFKVCIVKSFNVKLVKCKVCVVRSLSIKQCKVCKSNDYSVFRVSVAPLASKLKSLIHTSSVENKNKAELANPLSLRGEPPSRGRCITGRASLKPKTSEVKVHFHIFFPLLSAPLSHITVEKGVGTCCALNLLMSILSSLTHFLVHHINASRNKSQRHRVPLN